MWQEWWFWAAAAIVLAIAEVLMPAYVMLGFAAGAAVVSGLLAIGGAPGQMLVDSPPTLILAFAVASLIGWLALRRLLGVNRGQVKTFDEDINDS